jgi:APA family basic amino acid/polyamine antiporter
MIAYTGMETISNLAQETRDPPHDVPRAYKLVAGAVFSIYLTLPAIALMALPVQQVDGRYETPLGLPPEQHGFANDPVLGVVSNLGLSGLPLSALRVYVGVLAATILFIAANAGVIGSSRVTYAMASYRQLPGAFRRLHSRFRRPGSHSSAFPACCRCSRSPPAGSTSWGRCTRSARCCRSRSRTRP